MTAAVLTLDPAVAPVAPMVADYALGPEARRLRSELCAAPPPATSVLLDASRFEARRALLERFNEANQDNWDGYGAAPASIEILLQAWALLGTLPVDLPVPDVSIHPDGEVALEWLGANRSILTAAVGDDGWIKWAAIIGGERLYGRVPYADSLPSRLHRLVSEVIGSAASGVRAAGLL